MLAVRPRFPNPPQNPHTPGKKAFVGGPDIKCTFSVICTEKMGFGEGMKGCRGTLRLKNHELGDAVAGLDIARNFSVMGIPTGYCGLGLARS